MRIGDVSSRTGVPPATLRSWERRYGILRPRRTPGGQRQFRQSDVDRVLAVRELLAAGRTLAAAAKVVNSAPDTKPVDRTIEEQLYLTVMAASRDGVWAIDADSRTTYVNARMAEMLGRRVEDMVGVALFDLLPEERRSYARDMLKRRRDGVAEQHDFRFVRVDGTELRTLMSSAPLFDADGSFAGAVAVVTDVTEQKRADDAISFRNRLLDAVGQAVVASDPEGRVLYMNRAAEDVYGWRLDESLGRNGLEQLVPARNRAMADEVMEALRGGSSWSGDTRMRRRDRSEFIASLSIRPVFDREEHLVAIISVATDVTARRAAEIDSRRYAAQQETVALIGMRALAGVGVAELLDEAVRAVALVLHCTTSEVLEALPDGHALVVRAATTPDRRDAMEPGGLGSHAGYTLLRNGPVVGDDLQDEQRFDSSSLVSERHLRSGASVVIGGRAEPYGVLSVHSQEQRQFSGQDVSFLKAVANVIATAVERESIDQELAALTRLAGFNRDNS